MLRKNIRYWQLPGTARLGFQPPWRAANAFCPNLLHPYARKAVADLSSGASFLPITLPLINFDQEDYQARQKAGEEKSSEG